MGAPMTARCSHGIREDNPCAACDDVGPAFRAWDRGGYHARTTTERAETAHAAYAAGRADAVADRQRDADRIRAATGLAIIVAAAESQDSTLSRVGLAACSLLAIEHGVTACVRGVEQRGRGSRARYRRAVVEAIRFFDAEAELPTSRYGDVLGVAHTVDVDDYAARCSRAADRCRRILAKLDVATPDAPGRQGDGG